tara:strand:+ start:196 stop:882 length:687 start_codon:yes stop_codon:yes gene_type:complete
MNKNNVRFDHLINNLERVSSTNSIFNKKLGQKAFLSLGHGDYVEWLETLLPNTRLIIEPKIIGSCIAIQYIGGNLIKAINSKSEDITKAIKPIINIPKKVPFTKRIEIQGELYSEKEKYRIKKEMGSANRNKEQIKLKELKFCAFHIFNCNINHFQSLQELKNLNFEIPKTQFTNFTSDVEIYRQCWKEGKLFQTYPTKGIVMKINSRKLQKNLGQNRGSIKCGWFIK